MMCAAQAATGKPRAEPRVEIFYPVTLLPVTKLLDFESVEIKKVTEQSPSDLDLFNFWRWATLCRSLPMEKNLHSGDARSCG